MAEQWRVVVEATDFDARIVWVSKNQYDLFIQGDGLGTFTDMEEAKEAALSWKKTLSPKGGA